jgi:serine/threonine protein kinase
MPIAPQEVEIVCKLRILARPISTGVHGKVYAIVDPMLKKEVAIKYMADGERARNEFQALKRCRNFHVIAEHGFATSGDLNSREVCIVMDRADVSLDKLAGTPKMRDEHVMKRITIDILKGISHVHMCGVVHRDIKPANLLLHKNRVVISDFGHAGISGRGMYLENTDNAVVTCQYRPPDIIMGSTSHR